MARYWYVNFVTEQGPSACFYRSEKHPLHPDELPKVAGKISNLLTKATSVITYPSGVCITGLIELESDVAAARWPVDFEMAGRLDPARGQQEAVTTTPPP